MDENKFWNYISMIDSVQVDLFPNIFYNKSEIEKYQSRIIKNILIKNNSFHEVIDFNRIYNEKLDDLFLPKIVELQLINYQSIEVLKEKRPHVSNDGFRDFRGYIIGKGREDYELVKNFDNENEIFHIDFHVNVAYRSDLEFMYRDLLNNHFLNFEEIFDKIDWKNLDKKYPKMIAKTKIEKEKYRE